MQIRLGMGLFFFVGVALTFQSFGQDFGFEQSSNVLVIEGSDTLLMPWSGGLNNGQFSNMDLDLDGTLDVIVFDKTGDRILPFLYNNSTDTYTFAPEYISKFPERIEKWCISKDFDGDGKYDLFYHVSAGIGVSRNISTQASGLKFEWWINTPQIHSDYGSGQSSNLYVSSSDVPAIADVDKDGDLDILTFSILGGSVEYHQNRSQEEYGHSDSLEYKLVDNCWGGFTEAFSYNKVFLDSCTGQKPAPPGVNYRHAGSTLLAVDEDGNGLIDLLLGDVTFRTGVMLYNGGTIQEAHMTSQDTAFPVNDTSIDVEVFPGFYLADIDKDGDDDMIASPNKVGGTENFKGTWYYENTGTNADPDYEFRKKDLFQGDMIDLGEGAFPRFFDENNDGLMDLIVGNRGYLIDNAVDHGQLALYRNIGDSANAVFELVTRDYSGIAQLIFPPGLIPAFGDIDGDGDADMFIGGEEGKIHLFTNTAGAGNSPNFVLTGPNYNGIDVGNRAAPFLVDLDRDGLIDLTIGDFYGQITYFENTGTSSSPTFDWTADTLGGVDVSGIFGAFGYCVPYFFEAGGSYRLAVGSTHSVHYYDNIDNNILGVWAQKDTVFGGTRDGTEFAAALHDLNNDGWMDMVVGNLSGGLTFFNGLDTALFGVFEEADRLDLHLSPNPTKSVVKIGGDIEGLIHFHLFDLNGRSVFDASLLEFNGEIKLPELNSGIYLVLIESIHGVYHKKLIIE